jgi:hypothetical protein
MKKSTMILAICALSIVFVGFAFAQTATQTFNLAVNSIYRISVSGSPADMTIANATAGADPDPVTNSATTYNFTTNAKANGGAKITASLAPALTSGYTLKVALDGGTAVDISTAAKDAVTNIAAGYYNAKTISYTFSATAAAGPLSSTGETVTLTVAGQ